MPQVDLSSVCGGVDRKVTCQTIAVNDSPAPAEDQEPTIPDYAPKSFWLSEDAEFDWFDQNAFIERKDSGKGSVTSSNLNNPNSVSSSQRYSLNLKSKASIIGLPKPQKPNYADRRTCRPANIRLFPKRPGPVCGRPGAVSEPSSPKVSCMGRVRSRKGRSRRGKKNRKKINEPGSGTRLGSGSGLAKSKSIKERKKAGFWNNFRGMFRSKGGNKAGCKGAQLASEPVKKSAKRGLSCESSGVSLGYSVQMDFNEVPGLGGVKRFASGRRSDAWAGEVEVDGSRSEPLDRMVPIWRRREAGPPAEVSVGRSWEAMGPASV